MIGTQARERESVSLASAAPKQLTFERPRRRLPRLPELDALRGLMLLGMTLTHLPTRASIYVYQPLGFVGWAEGFVLLSALLAGRAYGAQPEQNPPASVRDRLWRRALRLYGYHIGLLGVAFTLVATIAIRTQEPALQGLLDFYLMHRVVAAASSVFLVYCPPLLDILPMYIAFVFLTPVILSIGRRWGWTLVLIPSAMLWLAAQFGLREFLYAEFSRHTGLAIPLQNLGAFNLYAWQLLWIVGLWIGATGWDRVGNWVHRPISVALAVVITAVFLVLRFRLLPYFVAHPLDQSSMWMLFEKWRLGPMRLVNFAAFGILFSNVRAQIASGLAQRPLVLLGKASLEVFCIHVLFVFAALSFVGDGSRATWVAQSTIIVLTLSGMFVFAYLKANWRHNQRPSRPVRAFISAFATPASCSEFRPGFFLVKNVVWMVAQKFF